MAKFSLFGDLFKKGERTSGDYFGRTVHIQARRIIIDGKVISDSAEGVIELKVTEGVLENVTSSASVTCGDIAGNVDAGMEVSCGDVGGDADAGMNITCGDITGNADAGMSINARTISGKAKAGMTINR